MPLCKLHLVAASHSYRLVPKMVLTLCSLRWWCLSFHQLAQILHLHSWWSLPAATCTVWWWWWLCLYFYSVVVIVCGGGCIYEVVVVVHGGYAAGTQLRNHLEKVPLDSLLCCALIRTALCSYLCDDTTSVCCVTWNLSICRQHCMTLKSNTSLYSARHLAIEVHHKQDKQCPKPSLKFPHQLMINTRFFVLIINEDAGSGHWF